MFGLGKKHAPSADDIPSLKTSKLASLDLLAERTAPAEAGAIRLLYLLVVIQFVRSIWSKDGYVPHCDATGGLWTLTRGYQGS